MLIDTHCHLNDPSFELSLPRVIARARHAGVEAAIVPSYDAPSLKRTAELALQFPDFVFPAYGIHPWFVERTIDLDEIYACLTSKDTVAVGEIGLDFTPGLPDIRTQQKILARQLDFAADLNLPALIHCRKACDALYALVLPYKGKIKGVLHSFSGTTETMKKFLDLDFYISFSGSVTRTTAKKYHRNARAIPSDRFLVETDAPSIATETTVASMVEPRHAVEVAEKLAVLRDATFAEISGQSAENTRRLFHLNMP